MDSDQADRNWGAKQVSRRKVLKAGVLLPALGLPLVSGCGSGKQQPHASGSTSTQVPSSTAAVTTTTTEPAKPGPVKFAFAGDTHFVDQWDTEGGAVYTGVPVLSQQLRADPVHVLAPVAPVFASVDLAMVNLETAITDRGQPVPGKAYHFRSPAESFLALKSAGVDVVNMANNHALDYGPVGMDDTFEAVNRYGLPVVGIGHDASEAYMPYRATIHGQRIAIFGAVDWLEPALVTDWTATASRPGLAFCIDPAPLLAAVAAERPHVDTLVVFLHWGTEGTHCASPVQTSLAQSLISAGADLIVGSHAHRVFGAGHVGRSLVAYGLGNFVYFREDGESGSSGILLVTATGRHVDSYSWVPARIRHGIPVPETGGAAASDLSTWEQRRTCSALLP